MRIEELLRTMLRSFFVITTGIITSMYVFCLVFHPEANFSLDDIGRVLLMALASDLPCVIYYSRKELGKRQMFIRMIIHFPILLAILLYFAQLWDWVSINNPKEVIVFILLIMGVCGVVFANAAYQDKILAEKLNEGLKQRYHS
jgi:hypothetical protein